METPEDTRTTAQYLAEFKKELVQGGVGHDVADEILLIAARESFANGNLAFTVGSVSE